MWQPQPGPQTSAFLADWCTELFYGGERGSGKSSFQIGYQEDAALRYEGKSRGIMIRKTYPELEDLQAEATKVFTASGAIYKTQPSADFPFSNCWYWKNGATVQMRYLESDKDYGRYHGKQFSHISLDETTEYSTPTGLLKMLSTLRNPYGVPCSVRLTGNPGGAGHGWVKARYIDPMPPFTPYEDSESGLVRMFVPGKLKDNQILLRADPNYRSRVIAAAAGNEALKKAWTEGDWDIVAGAFFTRWDRHKHVIKPFTIPSDWTKFRSLDWGSAKPFSVHWFAVASGETDLPRGALVVYREWYGVKRDEKTGIAVPNEGLRLTISELSDGILERSTNEHYAYSVADPACWIRNGGPSHAEMMMRKGLLFRKADNSRIPGWTQVSDRLEGVDGVPMLYIFDTCVDLIRTLPIMQNDPNRLEDIDTDLEDHAVDDLRYGCASRPWAKPIPTEEKPVFPFEQPIGNLMWDNGEIGNVRSASRGRV